MKKYIALNTRSMLFRIQLICSVECIACIVIYVDSALQSQMNYGVRFSVLVFSIATLLDISFFFVIASNVCASLSRLLFCNIFICLPSKGCICAHNLWMCKRQKNRNKYRWRNTTYSKCIQHTKKNMLHFAHLCELNTN